MSAAVRRRQQQPTVEAAVKLGLTPDEYAHICEIQGGEPTYVELAIYSLMWSEHCSYKHSRPILGRFPTSGPRILQGPGENAGIIDVGDGWAVAMKVESHNHPSAVEPFQGAATGVGGIVRDIFTMGARPCVSLDSLRFGELEGDENARQRFLFEGVVGGIGFYGNCLGIPTVGGEVYFEKSYDGNCLVNAMCAGLLRTDQIVRAIASGLGNHVVLIGSKTGRDGIGGASVLASQEFDETLEEKRPIGPGRRPVHREEAHRGLPRAAAPQARREHAGPGRRRAHQLVVGDGQQGHGRARHPRRPRAAARGRHGALGDHDLREPGAHAGIVEPARLADVREVCDRWDLDCTVIGEVTDSKMLRIYWHGERVADIPARRLADEAPVIRTPSVKPDYLVDEPVAVTDGAYPAPADLGAALLELLAAPNIASKRWAYEQYDYIVQANTVQIPGSDAAVLRIKGTRRGIAFVNDCNGRHCYLDPYRGAKAAVAEAARNLQLRRRAARRRHRLPQLRQPREGRDLLDLRAGRRGHGRGLRGARDAGRQRQRELLQRELRQRHLPHADGRHAGRLSTTSRMHVDARFKDEGDVILLLGPPDGAAIDGSEYQKVPLRPGRGPHPRRRPGARE